MSSVVVWRGLSGWFVWGCGGVNTTGLCLLGLVMTVLLLCSRGGRGRIVRDVLSVLSVRGVCVWVWCVCYRYMCS